MESGLERHGSEALLGQAGSKVVEVVVVEVVGTALVDCVGRLTAVACVFTAEHEHSANVSTAIIDLL